MKPPPVIDNARVLEYALVGDAVFTGTLCLYVEGVRLGAVPKLAICENFDGDLLLFHCDEEWLVQGCQGWKPHAEGGSVAEIKSQAEKYYKGISAQWIRYDASPEDLEEYQASLMRCSFCGRTMLEVDNLLEGNTGALICNYCVTDFYEEKQSRG